MNLRPTRYPPKQLWLNYGSSSSSSSSKWSWLRFRCKVLGEGALCLIVRKASEGLSPEFERASPQIRGNQPEQRTGVWNRGWRVFSRLPTIRPADCRILPVGGTLGRLDDVAEFGRRSVGWIVAGVRSTKMVLERLFRALVLSSLRSGSGEGWGEESTAESRVKDGQTRREVEESPALDRRRYRTTSAHE